MNFKPYVVVGVTIIFLIESGTCLTLSDKDFYIDGKFMFKIKHLSLHIAIKVQFSIFFFF